MRHALAGVGENLRDHYAPRFTGRVKNIDTINERARGLRLAGEVLRWATTRKGILALGPTLVYCFWRSDPGVTNSDLQLTFTPASYKEGVQGQLDIEPGMTVAPWQQRPDSRGYVRLRSADPFDAPIIQPNYLAEEGDRRVLVGGHAPCAPPAPHQAARALLRLRGVSRRRRCRPTTSCSPPPSSAAPPPSIPPAPAAWGRAPIRCAVVDDELRVHGLEGLRVIDASIMPTMLSANLNAATLMLADKASDLIRGKAPPEPIVLASG